MAGSWMTKMKAVPREMMLHGTAPRGLVGVAVDKGERYIGSFGVGYLKARYRDRFLYKNHGLDLWGGVGMLFTTALLNAFTGGRSKLAEHTERLADVGIQSALLSIGASLGSDHGGHIVNVIPGKGTPSKLGPKQTMLGHIAPAMGGAYLTADQIKNYAGRR